MDLASRLSGFRERRGVSLQAVADQCGCTKAHLWEMENGRSDNPTLKLLRRLAAFYGVPVAALIGDDEDLSRYDAGWNAAMDHVAAALCRRGDR